MAAGPTSKGKVTSNDTSHCRVANAGSGSQRVSIRIYGRDARDLIPLKETNLIGGRSSDGVSRVRNKRIQVMILSSEGVEICNSYCVRDLQD